MRKYRTILILTCIGLLAGLAAAFLLPQQFTSQATLVVSPVQLPARYVQGVPSLDLQRFVRANAAMFLSRTVLMQAIQSHDLYPDVRKREPMEDVIATMRKAIRLEPKPDGTVEIAFTYTDRRKAQAVASDLSARLIDQSLRESSMQSQGTVQFLSDEVERAAAAWSACVRKVRATAEPDERIAVDRDFARKRYLDLKEKLADAEMVAELEKRRFVASLMVLDPATLPARPATSRLVIVALGALGGLILGVLAHFASRLRRGHIGLPVTA